MHLAPCWLVGWCLPDISCVCQMSSISLWLQIVVLTLGVAPAATCSLWLHVLVVTLVVAAGVAEESATSQSATSQSASVSVKACISRTVCQGVHLKEYVVHLSDYV